MVSVNSTHLPSNSIVEVTTLYHNHPTEQKVPAIVSFVLIAVGMAVGAVMISRAVNCLIRRKARANESDDDRNSVAAALKAAMPLQIFSQMKRSHSIVDDRVSFSPLITIDSSRASHRASTRNTLPRKDRTPSNDAQYGDRMKTFMRQARVMTQDHEEVLSNGFLTKSDTVENDNAYRQPQHKLSNAGCEVQSSIVYQPLFSSQSNSTASSHALSIISEKESPTPSE